MATVLSLRDGDRFEFTESCYCYLGEDGRPHFLPLRTVSGCLRIMSHRKGWAIDARRCSQSVVVHGKRVNDKPRMLPDRAIVTVGRERFLFAVNQAELMRAYEELLARSRGRGDAGRDTSDPFNEVMQGSGDMLDDEIDDTPTATITLQDDVLDPAGADDIGESSEFTLSGITERVISAEVESLHSRRDRAPAGDEMSSPVPHGTVGTHTGIVNLDNLATEESRSVFSPIPIDVTLDEDGARTDLFKAIAIEAGDADADETHVGDLPPIRPANTKYLPRHRNEPGKPRGR